MCIIKAHNAKVDYIVVKRNYFSDNSLSPETPNQQPYFMCNSLHPQLSPSHRLQPLFYFFLPIHSLHLRFFVCFFFFYSFASLFVFFCFRSIWLCDIGQRANWVHTFIMKECISVPGQTLVQTRKHIIYVLRQQKWTTDWSCTLVLAKKKSLPARAWNMDCGHIYVLDRVESHCPGLQSLPMMLDSSHCNYHIARVQFRNQGSFMSRSISQISSTKKRL